MIDILDLHDSSQFIFHSFVCDVMGAIAFIFQQSRSESSSLSMLTIAGFGLQEVTMVDLITWDTGVRM